MQKLGRAARAAAVAGLAACLATPAEAEIPASAAEANSPKVVVIEESQAREWELLIELDLMEDSVTFPHGLRCLASERGMEIRGYVPNPLVRARALSIAQKVSPMQVASGMVIQPNLDFRHPGKPNLPDVQARLGKVLGASGNVVRVQLSPSGQVILTGRAISLEDKVQFSRALRGLVGCTSVRNELNVVTGPAQVPVVVAGAVKPAAARVPPPSGLAQRPTTPPEVLPATRPPQLLRDTKPAATHMPPAPVAPAKAPDYLPATGRPTGVLLLEDTGSPVVQASKAVPPLPPPATRPPADKPAPASRPPEAKPGPVAEPKTPPTAFQATLSPRGQQAVRSRIRAALGANIKEVELKFDGKGGVKVIVAVVGKNTDHNRIAETIIQVPELQSFDVSMELRVE